MPSKLDNLPRPLIYLITAGETTANSRPTSADFLKIIRLVEAAVFAGVDLIQLREKRLETRVLYHLCERVLELSGGRAKILINDRADVAVATGADGVHLTTKSLSAHVVRKTFGDEILIGVSTHSAEEVRMAKQQGADFVVFGPVFKTQSKMSYGEPQGLDRLSLVVSHVPSFPVLALGGITIENARECISAGARGIAAISMLQDPEKLARVVETIRRECVRGSDSQKGTI